jgi:hypothetical protein
MIFFYIIVYCASCVLSYSEIDVSVRDDIESKIRRWGKLSGSDSPDIDGCEATEVATTMLKSDDIKCTSVRDVEDRSLGGTASNGTGRSKPQETKNEHPWDSSFPARLGKVDLNNTSMDYAAGIETTHTTKTGQLRKSSTQYEKRSISPVYRMRMEGAIQLDTQLLHNQGRTNSVVTSGANGTIQRNSPWHHESAKVLSDDFDSAWVSLPSSTFFKSGGGNSCDNDIFDTLSGQGSPNIERSRTAVDHSDTYLPRQSSSLKSASRQEENRISPRDVGINSSPSVVGSGKGKGLRGLLKRKGSLPRFSLDQTVNHLPPVKDYKSYTNEKEQTFQTSTISRSGVETIRGRESTSQSASPGRGRAKSLDERRIRNPSIARKFSRLLRVYDIEKDGMEV